MDGIAYGLAALSVGLVTVVVVLQVGLGVISVVTAVLLPVVGASIAAAQNIANQQNNTAILTALNNTETTAINAMSQGLTYGTQAINIFLSIVPVIAILAALLIIIALLMGAISGFGRPQNMGASLV